MQRSGRWPRQYGKSTWLEFQLRETLRQFCPRAALFLNGDYIAGPDELEREHRAAKQGSPTPMQSLFWRSDKHEIDFVRSGKSWIEVKAGRASPFEFDCFARAFPREKLLVINSERFEGKNVRGVTLEEFLLDEAM